MANTPRMGLGMKIATVGYILGFSAAALAVSAGLGNRIGLWTYREGFNALGWLVYVGGAAAVISALGIVLGLMTGRSGLTIVLALAGLILGSAVAWIPYEARMALRASPRLADITTDTAYPPAFVKIIPIREAAKARNKTDYTVQKAALQAKHYPDLKPAMLTISPDETFDRAIRAVKMAGLNLIDADKKTGRIEATATTFWFGFKDDVVIRIAAAPVGTRVDIRSSSRVGRREAGKNAARVRLLIKLISGK
ncbi:MAG: hypothetical protein ACI82H_000114 [Alphaproteobacteria bacterium]|jgi:uncharacterized protein (DUF1499 family)